jgi:Glyoxalase/Bleomycin resistance protein/Dioxygenase superfamily
MLISVDRIQLAVRDRTEAATTFAAVLDAREVRQDHLDLFNAERTVIQAGASEFELLTPSGPGAVAEHLERWGEGIFAAGFSTPDLTAMAAHLTDCGLEVREDGDQIFIAPAQTRGMRTVISPHVDLDPVGLVSYLYEVTNIVDDHQEAADFYADTFGLDSSRFCPIASEQYGYTGTLTLFDPPARLDRIELTQTNDPEKAMGRFYSKRGQGVYMCFMETADTSEIGPRLQARGTPWTPGRDSMFIHPKSLHGMLMGISRTTYAWSWSGHPELVEASP